MREMKDSGVAWIGEIPKEWYRASISYFSTSRSGGTPDRNNPLYWDNGTIPWVSSGEVNKGQIWSTYEMITDLGSQNSSAKILKPNSVFVALNGQGKTKGMTAILKIAAACNQSLCAFMCNPNKLHYEFLYYCFKAMYKFLRSQAGDDVRDGLAASFVRKQIIPVPPIIEQHRIADFLDAKCAEIDSILEKTRGSIEDYKKLKQSVITEVVTKGIRGDRSMKDSGVEWIGEIPANWIICRVKHVLVSGKDGIKIGPFGSSLTNKVSGEGTYKVYGQWNIVDKDFSAGKNFVSADTYHELSAYQVFPGDVLISMMGTIGKCATIPEGICEGIMDSHVIKARLNKKKIASRFFELIYDKDNSSFVFDQMQVKKKGSIMDGLNSTIVKNLILILPPLPEQQEIAAYLDEKCAAIDSLIASKEALITELEAYKKSIIYEYVTGKKEV